MRDYRNAKAMAQTLREVFDEKSIGISHSECLEAVARILGFKDWNVLAAKIEADEKPQAPATPAGSKEPGSALHCSFCGKSQYDVVKLIAGPDVFICDECVGLCDDVLLDNAPTFADLTRESLASRTTEDVILLKARIEKNLSTALRLRAAIAASSATGETSSETTHSAHVAFFLRKSLEERRAYTSEIETRIGSMEHAMALVREVLPQRV